jgi:hypothetical protein
MPVRRRQQGRVDNGDERKGAGYDALNNIYSNGYAQPNEQTSWRHSLRLDGKGMGTEDNEH